MEWIKRSIKRTRAWWLQPAIEAQMSLLQMNQISLTARYRQMLTGKSPLPKLRDVGFRVYSDCDEDGILLYLFALTGSPSRRLIDIGAATPQSASNTANLIIHHGWTGLLIDADLESVSAAREFYSEQPRTRAYPPLVVNEFLNAENINGVLRKHDMTGEVDLLSVDIDGMDYWLWKALDVITPRVVLIEFQDILGWERAVTVPYAPKFRVGDYSVNSNSNDYVGASLPAMVKLGRQKGYRLVGVNSLGFNAFFVRNDIALELLPEVQAQDCLTHPWNEYGMRVRYPRVQHMEWMEV